MSLLFSPDAQELASKFLPDNACRHRRYTPPFTFVSPFEGSSLKSHVKMQNLRKWLLIMCLAAVPGGAAEEKESLATTPAGMPDCAVSFDPSPWNGIMRSDSLTIPQVECLTLAIANSPCSASNQTCTCNDHVFETEFANCVTKGCTVKEYLSMSRNDISMFSLLTNALKEPRIQP